MRTRISVLLFASVWVTLSSLSQICAAENESAITSNNTEKDVGDSKSNETVASSLATSSNTTDAKNANSTEAASDGKPLVDTTSSEDDDNLPEGMSESLADFFLDILKGHTHIANATKPTAQISQESDVNNSLPSNSVTAPPVSNKATVNMVSDTGKPAAAEFGDEEAGTEVPNGETALEKFLDDEYDYWDDYWDDWSTLESSTWSTASRNNVDCFKQVDLNDYCVVDEHVTSYFKDDLTTRGLKAPIFDMDLVNRLMSCPRGQWCLGNELDRLKKREENFYQGPLCEESMWECLFDVIVQREECPDKEFMFVVDSVNLMCELFSAPLVQENQRGCFAHTLAALHVTYADFLANNMSDPAPVYKATCDGYSYRMTKTYLCADDVCSDFFETRVAMEKFERWSWFMGKVDEAVDKCDIDDTCGALENQTQTASKKTWFGMTTASPFWPQISTDMNELYKEEGVYQNKNLDSRFSSEDESLMVALSVATAVGLLFMVLGILFWRRSRRRNMFFYRTEGYGKVPGDEVHLLPGCSD